ncbi:MAG: endolytic transglycosylase MltG [Nitrospiraceae bacterium]|nr:endolytic transglycosylase MltG [Nitrospiraceae bacterium]
MRISIRSCWPILLYLVFISVYSGYRIWTGWMCPVSKTDKNKVITVPTGSTFSSVARRLEADGLIRSKTGLYVLAWWEDATTKIKAGEYLLSPTQTPQDILDYLVQGKVREYVVTIPEGFNLFQIADLLKEAGLTSRKSFLAAARDRQFLHTLGIDADSAEGYMYPDTYQLTKDATAHEIVRTFVERFWEVWNSEGFGKRTDETGVDIQDIVILASIVEKEAMRPSERPIIASVFWNRLKKGMPLQSDPTVYYGILVETKVNRHRLRWRDLREKTPYNTYRIKGFPAGPISNPGRASIRAVLYPARDSYLYFVSKNDGTHYFSRTLAEHNRAVDRYQRHISWPKEKGRPVIQHSKGESDICTQSKIPLSLGSANVSEEKRPFF